jgi:hypothetical protein
MARGPLSFQPQRITQYGGYHPRIMRQAYKVAPTPPLNATLALTRSEAGVTSFCLVPPV